MPLQPIPNQPISFEPVENCPSNFNTVYQLFKIGDKIQFQFKLDEPCSDNPINLIENGGFQDCETSPWDLNGCWTCEEIPGRSGVCWDSSAEGCDTPASLSQIITPTLGQHIYRVRFQVYEISTGSLTFQIGLLEYLTVTAPGVYEVYVVQTGTGGNLNFNFMPSSDFIGCIDNVEMVQMDGNGYAVGFFYADGTLIRNYDTIDNPDYFNYTKNYITFSVDFSEAADGCFYICIKDYCDCPLLPVDVDLELPDAPWVELTGTGSFRYIPYDGWIIFNGKDEGDADSIKSPDYLCVGLPYTIVFNIGNVPTNAGIKVRNGSQSTPFYNAAGTYSLDIIAEESYLIFDGQATANNGEAWVDAISIYPKDLEDSSMFDYCSQPFQQFSGDDYCTNLIEGCNDSDAFGFKFIGTGFKPSARLQSKLMPNNYNTQGSFEINSLGTRSAKYAEVRTARNLRIIDTPIYLWDFLARWIYLDHPTIEGEEYAFEEDSFPDVSYNKFMTRGTGSLPMGKKTQNMFKTNCSNENNC
jgi:hypothetical protein